MKIVNLHGKIGKEFGERWELEVDSITEALRAIDVNTGRFFRYLGQNQQENKTFSFLLEGCDEKIESKDELLTPLPKKCKEFHIIPNAEGALEAFLIPLVISLATGFIMRALFKPPKKEDEKQSKSFLFQGAENVAQQGVPVPLGYGRLLVGSVIVSAVMRHVDRHEVEPKVLSKDASLTLVNYYGLGQSAGSLVAGATPNRMTGFGSWVTAVARDKVGDIARPRSFGHFDPEGVFSIDKDTGAGAGGGGG